MRGISLNSEGIKQLNYQVLRQNVLDEIQRPLEKTRQTDIYKPYHIVRNSKEYLLTGHSRSDEKVPAHVRKKGDRSRHLQNISLWV